MSRNPREAVEGLLGEGPDVIAIVADDRVENEGQRDEQQANEAGRGGAHRDVPLVGRLEREPEAVGGRDQPCR